MHIALKHAIVFKNICQSSHCKLILKHLQTCMYKIVIYTMMNSKLIQHDADLFSKLSKCSRPSEIGIFDLGRMIGCYNNNNKKIEGNIT